MTQAPATAWLETQPAGDGKARKWPVKKLTTAGHVELDLPARELAPGAYSLTLVVAHGGKDQTRATMSIQIAPADPSSRFEDEDGDCQTVGEGDCDDKNERVSGFEKDGCVKP